MPGEEINSPDLRNSVQILSFVAIPARRVRDSCGNSGSYCGEIVIDYPDMRLTAALLLVTSVFAQTPRRLEFEVASVKAAAPDQGNGAQTPAGARLNPSQIRLSYLTLQDFIVRAYAVRAYQVIGPDWLKTERYDIAATLPEGATTADVPAMLQSLLEDRFGLKVHKSQKEFPVFLLTRGKRPLTITEVPPRDPHSTTTGVAPRTGNGVALRLPKGALFTFADNKLDGKGMTMDMLANNLSNFVGLPTVNGTDLNGYYDFHFDLVPEDFDAMMRRAAANRGVQYPPEMLVELAGMTNQSLLDGMEKVGLKLEKSKRPLEVVNIDEAKKTPTQN
jgi:uncharacterized protein (TIGR03435 family)